MREGEKAAAGLQAILSFEKKQHSSNTASVTRFPFVVSSWESRYVQIKFDDDLPWPGKLKPDHAYLAGDKDTIWFAFGRETAWQILEQKMGNREMKRAKSALANLSLDMSRFLDEDDPAGLHEFGKKLEVEYENVAMGSFVGSEALNLGDAPELLHMLAEGGKLKATLNSDKRGLFLRAELDEALARWLTARMFSMQTRVQNAMMERQEAEQEKQQEQMEKMRAREKAGSDN